MGKLKKGLIGAGAAAALIGGTIVGISGDPVPIADTTEYDRIIQTTRGKELKISGGNIIQAIVKKDESGKDILEIPRNKIPARATCNVLFVAEETEDGLPNVDENLIKAFGSNGNSVPIKLASPERIKPMYYWNALLIGKACVLAAESDGYYASSMKQIMGLPEEIKEDVLKVRAVFEEDVEGKLVQVIKVVSYGSDELDHAIEILETTFPSHWAGRSDINFVEEKEIEDEPKEPKKGTEIPR